MTFKEAQQKFTDNQNLIGTYYKGDEISDLIIVPANGDNLIDIVNCSYWENDYSKFLTGYRDFELYAIFTSEATTEGLSSYKKVNAMLDEI